MTSNKIYFKKFNRYFLEQNVGLFKYGTKYATRNEKKRQMFIKTLLFLKKELNSN